jgi:hypothetical protein
LSLAAAAAITAGILAGAWPALASDAPAPSSSSPSAEPTTDPHLPPGKPIPSGPTTEIPPTADPSITPPPWPSFPPDDPEDH